MKLLKQKYIAIYVLTAYRNKHVVY